MKRIAIILLIGFLALQGTAQEIKIYSVRDWVIGISIYYNDTLLNISSNKLRVVLDYETTDLYIILSPNTLTTNIDSLDEYLTTGELDDIIFVGQLCIDYINTEGHPFQEFDVEGLLTINGITKYACMQGNLVHLEEGPNIQCILTIHYDVLLADFKLDKKLPGFSEYASVEILQAILTPANNQY